MNVDDTKRLRFRLIDYSEADLLYQLDSDAEVMRYINGGRASTLEEIQQTQIPRIQSYQTPEKGWGIWIVLLRPADEFLGWILVRPMDFFTDQPDPTNLEIGWRFRRESWGNGYATEAAEAILNRLKRLPEVQRFTACAMTENLASIAIMKRLGMKYVKTDAVSAPTVGTVQCVYYERGADS